MMTKREVLRILENDLAFAPENSKLARRLAVTIARLRAELKKP